MVYMGRNKELHLHDRANFLHEKNLGLAQFIYFLTLIIESLKNTALEATPQMFFHITKKMFFRVTKYALYFLRWSGLLQSAAKKHLTVFKVCESWQCK